MIYVVEDGDDLSQQLKHLDLSRRVGQGAGDETREAIYRDRVCIPSAGQIQIKHSALDLIQASFAQQERSAIALGAKSIGEIGLRAAYTATVA